MEKVSGFALESACYISPYALQHQVVTDLITAACKPLSGGAGHDLLVGFGQSWPSRYLNWLNLCLIRDFYSAPVVCQFFTLRYLLELRQILCFQLWHLVAKICEKRSVASPRPTITSTVSVHSRFFCGLCGCFGRLLSPAGWKPKLILVVRIWGLSGVALLHLLCHLITFYCYPKLVFFDVFGCLLAWVWGFRKKHWTKVQSGHRLLTSSSTR